MKNGIFTINDYGYISVSIKPIMDKKGINRNELCRSIDSRYEVVNKWYNGTIEKIDTDVLARICYVLECKPEDIIHYNYPKSE